MFGGSTTPKIVALENAHQDRLATNQCQVVDLTGLSIWSYMQVISTVYLLACFAVGYDVCIVYIFSGYILFVANAYKHQHYDLLFDHTQYNDMGDSIPVKKLY